MKKPKGLETKDATRGSGSNNVANVKWANGTKEGNEEGNKVSK